jgi:hypothetical protein
MDEMTDGIVRGLHHAANLVDTGPKRGWRSRVHRRIFYVSLIVAIPILGYLVWTGLIPVF